MLSVGKSGTGSSQQVTGRGSQINPQVRKESQERNVKTYQVSQTNLNSAKQSQALPQWTKPKPIQRQAWTGSDSIAIVGKQRFETRASVSGTQTPVPNFISGSVSSIPRSTSSISGTDGFSQSTNKSPSPYADALKKRSASIDPIDLLTGPEENQGNDPRVKEYNNQIIALFSSNDENAIEKTENIIATMISRKLKLNAFTFTPILEFHVKQLSETNVIQTLQRMKNESVLCDHVIYHLLIDFYVSRNDFTKASSIFNRLPEEHFVLDKDGAYDLHNWSHGAGYMWVRKILAEQPTFVELIPGRRNHCADKKINMKDYIKEKIKANHRNYKCKPGSNEGRIKIIRKEEVDQRVPRRRGTI